jgi:cob(I)alamin adenosyltransferase
MVKLNKIYTRTGDAGSTGLGDGQRRSKDDARVAAYGAVDEANSAIGVARVATAGARDADLSAIDRVLARVQNDLFDLGADLCMPGEKDIDNAKAKRSPLRVAPSQVDALERAIDELNDDLQPLNSFVLPGGSPAAAALHLARAICRRAERDIVALSRIDGEDVGEAALAYINRLSDYLFVAARYANRRGETDVLWIPGANRNG